MKTVRAEDRMAYYRPECLLEICIYLEKVGL